MKKMKRLLAVLLCVCTRAALAGCGGDKNSGQNGGDSAQPSSGQDASGKKDSITVSMDANVTTLCPMESNTSNNQMLGNLVLSAITDFDDSWNVIPNIAESWEISEDGMTYTYTLRDDVYFHSGDKLTSEDVAYSVQRAIDSAYLKASFGKYAVGAEAVDETHVAIHLNQAYTPFLAVASKELFIHNQSYHDEYIAAGHSEAEYLMNLDGTGPYKFVSYEDGVGIEFEAFDKYFKGEPQIKHWYGKIIADNNSRALAIESGDIDLIETHTAVPASNLPMLREANGVVVEKTDFEKVGSIILNNKLPELSDVRVRKALAYAVDYDWLRETITNGDAYPTECAYLGHKTTGFSTADSIVNYTYDLEKAKALLAEAGYPNGEGFPVIKATVTELRKGIVEVLQQCWGDLGLTIEINLCESSVVWDEIRGGNFTIGIVFNNCMVDSTMYDSYFAEGSTQNFTGYHNPELLDLLAQAAQELDAGKRQEMFDQIWTTITDDAPSIWMYYEASDLIYREGLHVSGVYPTQSVVRYEDMYWE